MWIDIIQAYADALQVATSQRPLPARPRDVRRSTHEDAEARLATTPSPAVWRRIAGWLVRRSHVGSLGSDAGPAAAPTGLKACG
jgi:hypothetical protein